MKTIHNIYIAACLFSVLLTSCDLARDLDDYEPLNSLPAETAITNENTSELALAGIYSTLLNGSSPELSILGSKLSGVDGGGYPGSLTSEGRALLVNAPLSTGNSVLGMYAAEYVMINRANWVINGVEKLTDENFINDARRTEILGEAKTLRAMAHFNLLRFFGQYYDLDSNYGIDVRLEPARNAEAHPRLSVGETYDAILKDLDQGIELAPDLRQKYFVSKTFAKGLKAKVLLYMGKYAEAAALSKEVITSSGPNFVLESSFENLFDHSNANTIKNKEALFSVYSDDNELTYNGEYWSLYSSVSNWYYNLGATGTVTVGGQVIKFDGGRTAFMKTGEFIVGNYNGNMKFMQQYGPQAQFETLYLLRMAEMYLIYAEASARSTNSVSAEALASLNAVRIRAGATTGGNGFVTYPSTISYAQFLEAVRIEKLMELGSEFGEDWFDLVRYDRADGFGSGFKVSDVKATATNTDFYIMPIPQSTITSGKNVIKQNPGY